MVFGYSLKLHTNLHSSFVDPLQLSFQNEYNLNVIKEIEVTESFLTLDEDIRDCQNDESYDECKTRNYIDVVREKCNCLPMVLRLSENVIFCILKIFPSLTNFRILFALLKI